MLAGHFDRVVGLAYGSDVLRRNRSFDPLMRFGLKRVEEIAATNHNVMDVLLADFPFLATRRPSILRFGLPVFDELLKIQQISTSQAKTSVGFDTERTLISLGYSASSGQRQLELIDFFASHPEIQDDRIFVVPVQYGSQSVIDSVIAKCEIVNRGIGENVFFPLTEFHDPERSALMRRATDILINHSVSDAFSGTVQEVVYAGNLVLAGSHLPYRDMPGFGSAIKPFGSFDDVANALSPESLSEWKSKAAEMAIANQAELHATSSWDAVIADWRRTIDPPAR
ncbi:glycosyltransferase [Notoacmeibacter marinus]|uniref:glycosyltransferase n=1 Tax=Notoacmeibacter marinus TaxID=1876515 RepID=UPI0013B0653E|nr:glycosyltransferase [Notoacmeibacter marinus]